MANLAWGAIRTSGAMLSWLFSGMFQRFPNLKIALSEGEIGWMPYFLERAEQVLDKQRHWVKRGVQFMDHAATDVDLDTLDIRATFRDHIYGCFIEDHHGIASLDEIGEDNVMCETDYPHSDSTWPDCIGVARRLRRTTCPTETQYKILRGNAERLYRFTPAEPPVLGECLTCTPIARRSTASVCIGSGMCIVYAPAPSTRTPRPRRSSSIPRRPARRRAHRGRGLPDRGRSA